MEFNVRQQRGYLLLVAVLLIAVMSFVGLALAHMFTSRTNGADNILQAKEALYVASSGLEVVQRDIIAHGVLCTAINGQAKYTNSPLFHGMFTVVGSQTVAVAKLLSDVTSASSSIHLTTTAPFADKGIIKIGTEYISYQQKSGDFLLDIMRGISGTVASDHYVPNIVRQAQCFLSAKGGVPNLIAAVSDKRTLRRIIVGQMTADPEFLTVVASASYVRIMGGAKLINPSVTKTHAEYSGSTVITAETATLAGGGETLVGDGAGGVEVSSSTDSTEADIEENTTRFNAGNLFEKMFGQPESLVSSVADHSYNKNNIDGVQGKIIWVDGDLSIAGNGTMDIGTPTNPVILVIDGDFYLGGTRNLNFYGLLFAKGNIDLTGGGDFGGLGTLAATGHIDMAGNKINTFDPNVLANLPGFGTDPIYADHATGIKEFFH